MTTNETNTMNTTTVGEEMNQSIMDGVIPSESGMRKFEVNDNTQQYQSDINKKAIDSMFDKESSKKSESKSNGETIEYEVDTTVEVVVDDSKLDKLLPIEKVSYDMSNLNEKEKEIRNTLLEDLGKAQYFTIVSLYYYVKVGKKLIDIKTKREKYEGSLQRIIQSVGLNERTAYRYMKIAKDDRFSMMDEKQFKSLHHLTQNKMILMTKFDDTEFYKAINDEDYVFNTNTKKPKVKPKSYSITDELYQQLITSDKDYIVRMYDSLYKEKLSLLDELEKYGEAA